MNNTICHLSGEGCIRKHTTRASYQAFISRYGLQCSPSILDPVGLGWPIDGKLSEGEQGLTRTGWMQSLLQRLYSVELLACRCVRFCRLHDCVCMANGLTLVQTCVDNQFVKEARLTDH